MEDENYEPKIQVAEKGFPSNIPDDLGSKPLEVISEVGETVALFYDISFIRTKPKDLVGFIENYDLCFDDDLRWLDPDADLESEYIEWMESHENFNDVVFFHKFNNEERTLSAICRLTYPFHLKRVTEDSCYLFFDWWARFCDEEQLMDLAFSIGDVRIMAKLFSTLMDPHCEQDRFSYKDIEKYLNILIKMNNATNIYEYPELFFSVTSIDKYLEISNKVGATELQTFIQNYKNKNFPTNQNLT